MAIIDNTLVFSDQQAITATAASTNVIDLLKPGTPYGFTNPLTKDVGVGRDIPMFMEVTEDFNNLTSLTIAIQVATDAAFTTPVIVSQTGAILLATLKKGYKVPLLSEIPQGTNLEFVRLMYTVTGTAPSTGKIFAAITAGDQTA